MVEVAVLFFALAGAFDVLQDALNSIWGVKPKPEGGTLRQFRRRFLSHSRVILRSNPLQQCDLRAILR